MDIEVLQIITQLQPSATAVKIANSIWSGNCSSVIKTTLRILGIFFSKLSLGYATWCEVSCIRITNVLFFFLSIDISDKMKYVAGHLIEGWTLEDPIVLSYMYICIVCIYIFIAANLTGVTLGNLQGLQTQQNPQHITPRTQRWTITLLTRKKTTHWQ